MNTPAEAPPSDPNDLLDACLDALAAGVRDRRHGFHLPVIATADPSGNPDARTVVLRSFDRDDRTISCHTDRRSPKAAHLLLRAECVWVFYDTSERLQIRVRGRTTLHTDDETADDAWERTRLMSRRCYLAPAPPSSAADGPSANLPEWAADAAITEEDTHAGRPNFAVIRTRIDRLDCLRLHHAGHRRAAFTWTDGRPDRVWLEP